MSFKFQESPRWLTSKFLPVDLVLYLSHQAMEASQLPRPLSSPSNSLSRRTTSNLASPPLGRHPWTFPVCQLTLRLLASTNRFLRLLLPLPRPQCLQVFLLHHRLWREVNNSLWTRLCRTRWWIVKVVMKDLMTREVEAQIARRMNRWEKWWWCKWWWLDLRVELTQGRWCRKWWLVAHLIQLILGLIYNRLETTKSHYGRNH